MLNSCHGPGEVSQGRCQGREGTSTCDLDRASMGQSIPQNQHQTKKPSSNHLFIKSKKQALYFSTKHLDPKYIFALVHFFLTIKIFNICLEVNKCPIKKKALYRKMLTFFNCFILSNDLRVLGDYSRGFACNGQFARGAGNGKIFKQRIVRTLEI